MDILSVSGTGTERGLIHGSARAEQIATSAQALREHLTKSGVDVPALAERLVAGGLVTAARTHTPDLWDEVLGISAGSRTQLGDILLLTFLDEVWSFTGGLGCSVVARTSDRLIGQTMDLPTWAAGRLMVLRVSSPTAPTALLMTYPGLIGLCGANAAGVSVAVNALEQFTATDGLGVAFITRALLTMTSLKEAGEFIARIPHAAGQAYTIAAPDGLATWECGPGQVTRVTDRSITECAHTNHLLADPANATRSSLERLETLHQALAHSADLRAILSKDVVLSDPRTFNSTVTFAAFIAGPPAPAVEFADGLGLRSGAPDWRAIPFEATANH